jgi:hypothetical protein
VEDEEDEDEEDEENADCKGTCIRGISQSSHNCDIALALMNVQLLHVQELLMPTSQVVSGKSQGI